MKATDMKEGDHTSTGKTSSHVNSVAVHPQHEMLERKGVGKS